MPAAFQHCSLDQVQLWNRRIRARIERADASWTNQPWRIWPRSAPAPSPTLPSGTRAQSPDFVAEPPSMGCVWPGSFGVSPSQGRRGAGRARSRQFCQWAARPGRARIAQPLCTVQAGWNRPPGLEPPGTRLTRLVTLSLVADVRGSMNVHKANLCDCYETRLVVVTLSSVPEGSEVHFLVKGLFSTISPCLGNIFPLLCLVAHSPLS